MAIITRWDFNSNPADSNTATGITTPSIGSGTLALLGTTATFASGDAGNGSSDPVTGDDSGYNLTSFPTQSTGDKSEGIQFNVSTVGQQNITIKFDQRHSNTSSRYVAFQYTTDGTNFIDFGLPFDGNAGDTWFNNRTVDLSSITAVNNNPNFGFRIVSTFAPSTTSYAASNSASSYGTTGTWRFDCITVESNTAASPTVNLSVSPSAGTEAGTTAITVTATASSAVAGDQTVNLGVSGTGITAGDYTLSNTTITIPNGATTGSVTFTVADDAEVEGTETAALTISNPSAGITLGTTTSQNITITDNDVAAGNPPTIQESTTASFVNLNATTSGAVSGVINDPTDPARILGIDFTIADTDTPAGNLTVTATSSNQSVVPNANLNLTGTGADRNLKITPNGVGLADITVTVSDGTSTANYLINYAASAASVNPTTTRFHTGTSDASSAIAIDSDYMVVADDEDQVIRLFDRNDSGLSLKSFNFTTDLGLTQLSGGFPREVDIEASTRLGNTIYWMGSHSNSSGGADRPNRERIFATNISGSGIGTTLTYAGRYDFLEDDLIAWDNANGHGLGAGFLGFSASAAATILPEQSNGFNIEGLTIAPDGTTGYVSFRAPQTDTTARDRALIVPVTNFTTLLSATGGGTAGSATFGAPIQLDLGGRGIRSIDRNASNQYLIVAGPAGAATGTAPNDFRLYTWTGNASDKPLLQSANLTALNADGSFESIVEVPSNLTNASPIQLLVDNGDSVWYSNGTISKELTTDNFQKFRSETVTLGLRIRDIQGSAHVSPLVGQAVSSIPGIVTAKRSNGFYIQDPTSDNNDATSEGIFVFTNSAPTVNVGDSVLVSGTVSEFRPGGSGGTNNLSITQIGASPTITTLSTGNSLPATTILGNGGRTIPTQLIANDAAGGSVENSGTVFDPAEDGIDFYESLEGMLVQVNNPFTTSRTNNFGEVWVLADNGANATQRTPRGSSIISATDFNPERIQIDDTLLNSTNPNFNVGDLLNSVTGVIDYSFGNYELLPSVLPSLATASTLTKEVTSLVGDSNKLTVATFNVENLDPNDGTAKFNNIATTVVNNLKSPDIISLEEVQDNNGATNDGVVDASTTYQTLINAIAVAGGPTYQFRQIDPADDLDGGEPGGNIRVGFFFNPDRVTFVDRPGGNSTTATAVNNVSGEPQLSASPGRIDPTNAAFNSSRKPLVGEFVFNGETIFVVGNHFNSKGGDQPLFGRFQPPTLTSETQRNQQATLVKDFVQSILTINPNANVIVAGDLNDFEFSNPLSILKSGGLNVLSENLPENERYTYNFEGNAQSLDHILASDNLNNSGAAEFDVVHVNSEFFEQVSDHDPLVSRFTIAKPTVAIAPAITPNETGLIAGTFNLTRTGNLTKSLAVNYTLAGTATVGTDYTDFGSGIVTFAANSATATVTLPVNDDDLSDPNETIIATITSAANYDIVSGSETGKLTIVDNDSAGVTVSATSVSAAEGGASASYTVQLTSQPTSAVTISFNTGTQVSAIADLTFNSTNWNVPQNVTVTAVDDSVVEGNHTATITANAASTDPNYNGIAIAAVTANIADNDTAPIGNIECNCPPMPEPPQIPGNSPTRPTQNGAIEGTNNNDVLIGSNRPNLIFALGGNDTVIGQSGSDTIYGENSELNSSNLTGRDLIYGSAGSDMLFGNRGEDSISGGQGNDIVYGGQDNDLIHGDSGSDSLYGNLGNDSICGAEGEDLINGNEGQDYLCGSQGKDTLYGGSENDTLIGENGKDWLFGGAGSDLLAGGNGSDCFVLQLNSSTDTIADFQVGTDRLVLAGGLTFQQLRITQGNGGALISANSQVLAVLNGVNASQITGRNFDLLV
ncbi:MAG: hypothetical protein MUE44_35620 [Oscillatoriaceae cyanobacterium Prado104]|jgi:hypothetical protein|nr:hypothetical protein [Oscillatoriaceae cyanobacterium Prado104]